MEPERDTGNHWDRVAAELRACREAQQRAWGDIDNTTLGRFLAGEVTLDEQQQIENALDELPELRKLTDLVRDVLGESEIAAPGPATLPFPQPQHRTIVPAPMPSAKRTGRPWLRDAHFHQRAGLVAAAGLLLVLGFTLPRAGGSASQAERTLALSQPVATHVAAFEPDGRFLAANFDGRNMPLALRKADNRESGLVGEEQNLLDRISASVQALETEGKPREAETLARQYASNLTRKAWVYQEKGDLARAEPALNQACTLCDRTWGPEAPETVRTRNSLAGVYEVALNATPPSPYTYHLSSSFANSYTAPLPRSTEQPYFHADQPAPAPVPASPPRDSSHRSPVRSNPLLMASATNSHSKRESKKTAAKMHHSYHAPRISQAAAVALREHLTRKSQSELKASVVPVLTKALREATDSAERQRLVRALGQLGPIAHDAAPLLIDCYSQTAEPSERVALLSTLTAIGPTARCRWMDLAKRASMNAPPREVLQCINSLEGRSGIIDEAECFSVHALQQSQKQIRQLAKTYGIEVLIETVPAKVVADRQDLAANAVYLRINRDVPRVQIHVSEELRKRGLTVAQLRQAMEPSLRKKDFDGGLQAGVELLAAFEAKQAAK